MNSLFSRIQIALPVAQVAGLILAIFFGINIAQESYTKISLFFIGCCVLTWTVIGRKVWWLPIFFFMYLGGFFFVGFRIYSHELAVLICLLPLILALAMKSDELKDRHFSIPLAFLLLFIYLCLHFVVCAANSTIEGVDGMGNIVRRYIDAIWPFLVFLPFLKVGNTKFISWALHLIAGATVIRFALGMYSVFFGIEGDSLSIPGISFFPAGGGGAQDLRFSGSSLVSVALCYFCIYRSLFVKALLMPMIAVGVWGTFLGGGRITIVVLFGLFGFLFLIYRNLGLLFISASGLFITVFFINTSPEALYRVPDTARRAASVFLVDRSFAADIAEAQSSDEWHERLIQAGWKSWTSDKIAFLFGRGVKRFDENAWLNGSNFEGMIDMAVQTSRFESGIWDVLCTFGLVGLLLYAVLLWKIVSYSTPILFRDKIQSPVHAIMFIAVYQCVIWVLLCWISGSFPSTELLIGIVAMVAAHDMNREADGKRKLEWETGDGRGPLRHESRDLNLEWRSRRENLSLECEDDTGNLNAKRKPET